VSTPKLIKPIEDTPDIGSVFLSYFGEPSEPPLSPKPKQDEWTRFAAAQNHLCAQAPVPQRSRLRRRTQASAEHKNWSEWSVPAPASSKVNKHKKVSRHLLRKKSSDPPCVLNISRPIPVGPIETTGIHPPEWYPNRFCGIEVAIDQIGLTVTRPQNGEFKYSLRKQTTT
jgi:hypothetical protein